MNTFTKIYNKILSDWKTSAQPILLIFMVFPPFATVDGSPIHNKTILWAISVLAAMAKVYIGFLQKDAGTVLAHTPDGIKVEDSHEVPDNPKAFALTDNK